MDPGTALSVVQLVYGITRDLYEYYRAWKHCDKDVEELRIQLLWLHDAFRVIRGLLQNSKQSKDANNLVCTALEDCKDAATELSDVLEKVKKAGPCRSLLDKLKAQGRKAYYPFRKSTIVAISENLETFREALHLAVDLLHLDLSTQMEERLQLIDEKLTNGFDSIDEALRVLPIIRHDASETKKLVLDLRKDFQVARKREDMQAVLDWVCPSNYGQQLSDVLSRRKSGTDSWFLESSEFRDWREGAKRTLFCPGHPGSGKTILAAAVVDYLLRTIHSTRTPVAYLFCDYKRRSEQDAEHIVSTLLRQIVCAVGSVSQPLDELYRHHLSRNTRPSIEELETAFRFAVATVQKIYIVIDGLDECDNITRKKILQFIKSMQERAEVSLLATSRFIPEVEDELRGDHRLQVLAHDDDVKMYIESRICELARCVQTDTGLQEQVIVAVVQAVKGMFLLARLHMDSLRTKRTTKAVKLALENLPSGSDAYNTIYEDTLKRICAQPEDDRIIALEALAWVVHAFEPLRGIELQVALAVEPHANSVDEDAIMATDEILNLCAGLITKDHESEVVRLVHYTAYEYLVRTNQSWMPDAEATIALKCLTYISFPKFATGSRSDYQYVEQLLLENPLYKYAAGHWDDHFYNCEMNDSTSGMDTLESAGLTFLQNDNSFLLAFEMGLSDNRRNKLAVTSPSKAHRLATVGSVRLMEMLVGLGEAIDVRDKYHRTPMWWATFYQHEALTRFLLSTGQCRTDLRDAFGYTPLFHAVSRGNVAIVEMILDHENIDINRKYRAGRTLLSTAAQNGNLEVVSFLLRRNGIISDCQDDDGRTALYLASQAPHEAVVELLLNRPEIDPNRTASNGSTPLSQAAKQGNDGIVKLLLAHSSIDVNAQAESGTPLTLAAWKGHTRVVKMLLGEPKTDPDLADAVGRTPIMWALTSGNETTFDLLLDTKIHGEASSRADAKRFELRRRDHLGCTFVHLCAIHNSIDGIELAFKNGVDLDTIDDAGWTPLHWCAYFSSHNVAKLLAQKGASTSLRDFCGRTCVQIAIFAGNDALAGVFMHDECTVEQEDAESETQHGASRAMCDGCDHVSHNQLIFPAKECFRANCSPAMHPRAVSLHSVSISTRIRLMLSVYCERLSLASRPLLRNGISILERILQLKAPVRYMYTPTSG